MPQELGAGIFQFGVVLIVQQEAQAEREVVLVGRKMSQTGQEEIFGQIGPAKDQVKAGQCDAARDVQGRAGDAGPVKAQGLVQLIFFQGDFGIAQITFTDGGPQTVPSCGEGDIGEIEILQPTKVAEIDESRSTECQPSRHEDGQSGQDDFLPADLPGCGRGVSAGVTERWPRISHGKEFESEPVRCFSL